MLDAVLDGLWLVVQWPAIGYLFLGVLIGLYFGAIPGLSGLVGLAILLPFTFLMDPVPAFAFLLGMFAVTTTSDTLASVLLGVPGTAASQATILDGYPLAMKGEADRAFGAAFTVSALGGVLGAVALAVSIPIVKPLIFSFAKPEFFALGVLGLTMIGSLSGGNMVKGLFAALIGLLISMVGYSLTGGVPRYWLGATYLLEGIPIVPMVLGLFAVPEVIELAVRNTSISRVPRSSVSGGMKRGICDAFRNWWLFLRSSAIGIYIGMLPGLGGVIVDWIAYGHAVQSAKDKSQFGKGDIRGVIAPESANNAMKGGALMPTVAFGIPGSPAMAILLGAFVIQGFMPGMQMLTTKLDLTFSMVWTLAIANVLGAVLLLIWAKQIAKITFLPSHLIVPAVVLFVMMGAWMSSNTLSDWWSMLVFGVIGYWMKQGGIPRPPLILGFVLGPIMESALYVTYQAYGPISWIFRPICLVILILAIVTIVITALRGRRHSKEGSTVKIQETQNEDQLAGFVFIFLMVCVFFWAGLQSLGWERATGQFPIVVCVPAVVLGLLALFRDGLELKNVLNISQNGLRTLLSNSLVLRELPSSSLLLLSLVCIAGVTVLFGQAIAIPLFILGYLIIRGKTTWLFALSYAAIAGLILYFMFGELIGILWYPSIFIEYG
ncbi:MAG: tricarboxylate transporter [Rhodospirillaceae bacterium]|nr:tricarboxylate transporter [Rhodospirillaceae bacterium]